MSHHDGSSGVAAPLILSSLAGLSTGLGAAVVFCTGTTTIATATTSGSSSGSVATLSAQPGVSKLGHRELAFALSLAGSVMVTVSIVSILPESFEAETSHTSHKTMISSSSSSNAATSIATTTMHAGADATRPARFIAIGSGEFVERTMSILLGCAMYILLSKCAFPEPDIILGLDDRQAPPDKDLNTSATTERERDEEEPLIVVQQLDSLTTMIKTVNTVAAPPPTVTHEHHRIAKTTTHRKRPKSTLLSCSDDTTKDVKQQPLTASPSERTDKERGGGGGTRCVWSRCCGCHWWRTSGSDLLTDEARRNWRVTLLLFISLTIHNFPEGLAVAASTMHSQSLGITTTIAIALHNIPEGVAIAVPCLAARPDAPCFAFGLALLSGLSEPLGAVVALWVLRPATATTSAAGQQPTVTVWNMQNILAFVAGIMITVALVELFPEAIRHSKDGRMPAILGAITGMLVMILSEAMMGE